MVVGKEGLVIKRRNGRKGPALDWARVAMAITAFVVVAQLVHTGGSMATMGYYMDPAYLDVWSPIMMPSAGPPPAEFYMYSVAFTLVAAIFFVLVYFKMGYVLPERNRGLLYGLLIFLAGGLPGYLSMMLLVRLPLDLVAIWAAEGLVVYLLNGAVVARLFRKA